MCICMSDACQLPSCHQRQLNGFLQHVADTRSAHSQPNECASDYIYHWKFHFRIKAKVNNTSDHRKTDARPNLPRLFQLTAGKVSHFQFQCNVRLLWFSLWIVKVRKKSTDLNSICIAPIISLILDFSSKAHGWWIPDFLYAKCLTLTRDKNQWAQKALFKKQNQKALWVKADKSDVQYSPYSKKQELDEK